MSVNFFIDFIAVIDWRSRSYDITPYIQDGGHDVISRTSTKEITLNLIFSRSAIRDLRPIREWDTYCVTGSHVMVVKLM